ncbi:hypothetical protein Q6330_27160, partial [Klebsiella pneumoniae]|uniref:hypothetical protein n=1 Tax=Klebsiella pneumoniae TaxID=573 RepID=UPI00275F90AD|nr:hypothetical protein [Klebsiella pneumoniae]
MKKPELTATSVEKFLIEKFDSVSDLMQLSEGEESRAFSFDVGGRGYVLRGVTLQDLPETELPAVLQP